MSNDDERLSIAEMVEDAFTSMRAARKVTKADLVVLGGEFNDALLPEFLKRFSALIPKEMPWSMIETVDSFMVRRNAGFDTLLKEEDAFFLERLRVFGRAADLDLRRDGSTLRWRYLGDTNVTLPVFDAPFAAANFWDTYGDRTLYAVEEQYLQWWENEQRVAAHWAETEEIEKETRWLTQVQYLDQGQVIFARYLSFTRVPGFERMGAR